MEKITRFKMKPETRKRVWGKIKKYLIKNFVVAIISAPFAFFATFLLRDLIESSVGIYICRYAMSLIEQPKTHIVKKIIYYYFVVCLWINILVLILSIIGLIILLIILLINGKM